MFVVVGVVCCQVESLRRADHSSGGIVPSVVSLSVIVNPQQRGGLGPLGLLNHGEKENLNSLVACSSCLHERVRLRLKCDGTRAETRFRVSAKGTSPFNP